MQVNHELRDLKDTVLELKLPPPSTKLDENNAIDGYEVWNDGEESSGVDQPSRIEEASFDSNPNNNKSDSEVYAGRIDQDFHPHGTCPGSSNRLPITEPASAAAYECNEKPSFLLLSDSNKNRQELEVTASFLRDQLRSRQELLQELQRKREQEDRQRQELDCTLKNDLEQVRTEIRLLLSSEDVIIKVEPLPPLPPLPPPSSPPPGSSIDSTVLVTNSETPRAALSSPKYAGTDKANLFSAATGNGPAAARSKSPISNLTADGQVSFPLPGTPDPAGF